MPDMNLRELLAHALHEKDCGGECGMKPGVIWFSQADRALDRLTQPDILDEFERRCSAQMNTFTGEPPALAAKRVLAHMLTETKEGTNG